jgi:hypothetical protein
MGGFFLPTVADAFVLLVIVATALIWRRHQRVVPSTLSPGDFFIDSMNVRIYSSEHNQLIRFWQR